MTESNSIQQGPRGVIRDEPVLRDGLPREYLDFLRKHDLVETWENVVPLETPLESKGIDYSMPWDHIPKLVHYAPNLIRTCEEVEWGNAIAPVNGLRYAYTRLVQHAHILKLLDVLLQDATALPTAIIEVGCFTGGLLHFLAERIPTVQTVGFDLSPVALAIASRFSDAQGVARRPLWLEADFSLARPENLTDEIRDSLGRPIILLSNVIHAIGEQLSFSPAVDRWHAEAGLISYWVNLGATVVVSDRGDDTEGMTRALVENGRWKGDHCHARIFSEFECWSTRRMRPDCPLGDWYHTEASVLIFRDETDWS